MQCGRGEPSWSSTAQLGPEGQQWAAVLLPSGSFLGGLGGVPVLKLFVWLSAGRLSCGELVMWFSWGGTSAYRLAARAMTFPRGVQLGRADGDLQP